MNEELEQQLHLSSRKRRIAAFMIDHFVLTFLIVSIVFLALGPNFIDGNNIGKMPTTISDIMLPGFFLYFAKDSIKGISVGKWIMGIMVRDANNPNKVPSFGILIVRNLFIIIWPVELIVLALSQEKKRLGDKTVKTIVIKNPKKPTELPRVLTFVGIVIFFFTLAFLFTGTAMKNSEAYKAAVKEIIQNEGILEETGGIKGFGMMPTGSVSTSNGYAQAQFEIKVIGSENDLNVNVYLIKEPNGEWKLIELNK